MARRRPVEEVRPPEPDRVPLRQRVKAVDPSPAWLAELAAWEAEQRRNGNPHYEQENTP